MKASAVHCMVLAHLLTSPQQRLVHQHDDGIVCPESVFFRRPQLCGAHHLPGHLRTLKTLIRRGWIERVNQFGGGSYGFQDEYQISASARALFETEDDWALALDVWRKSEGLPPLRPVA